MKVRRVPYYPAADTGKKLSRKWYAVFVDYSEVLRRLPLFTDRKASEELARKVDRLNSIRAAGDTIPPDLSRYLESMPPGILTRLAKWDIVPASRMTASKPLSEHVDDWYRSLLAKGTTGKQAELVKTRVNRIIDGCGFDYVGDISAAKVMQFTAALREGTRPVSERTSNFYLGAMNQFCRWLVSDRRITENPMTGFSKADGDGRHQAPGPDHRGTTLVDCCYRGRPGAIRYERSRTSHALSSGTQHRVPGVGAGCAYPCIIQPGQQPAYCQFAGRYDEEQEGGHPTYPPGACDAPAAVYGPQDTHYEGVQHAHELQHGRHATS